MNRELMAIRWQSAWRRVRDILVTYDTEVAELFGSGIDLLFALWILFPALAAETSPTLLFLDVFLPRGVWVALFLSVGLCIGGAVALNSRTWRQRAVFANAIFWLMAAVGVALNHGGAAPVYFGISLASAFVYLRVAGAFRKWIVDSRPSLPER